MRSRSAFRRRAGGSAIWSQGCISRKPVRSGRCRSNCGRSLRTRRAVGHVPGPVARSAPGRREFPSPTSMNPASSYASRSLNSSVRPPQASPYRRAPRRDRLARTAVAPSARAGPMPATARGPAGNAPIGADDRDRPTSRLASIARDRPSGRGARPINETSRRRLAAAYVPSGLQRKSPQPAVQTEEQRPYASMQPPSDVVPARSVLRCTAPPRLNRALAARPGRVLTPKARQAWGSPPPPT